MKKLMIAAAAAACGSVFALESANVVGYQANAVPTGYSMVTPSFVNVDGTDYAIDNLTLIGVNDMDASVQVVNEDGSWGTQGFWLNEAEYDGVVYPAGWFTDASGETAANITLKPGQAVFFKTTASAASVQSAGQVSGNVTMNLATGYSMIGNTTPANMPIDSITLVGVNDMDASVQVVNADGSWGTQGFWLNETEYDGVVYPAGWFTDASGETPANITLTPGQSVFFKTTATGAKATIPSALK